MNRLTRLVAVTATAGFAAASIAALGVASTASASTHPSKAAAAATAARAALRGITAGLPATNQAIPGTRNSVKGVTQFESGNWSGYANDNTKGNTYSQVSGDWTQPKITCPTKEEQLAAFWVGIDGFSSGTVEQDGTLAQCFEGTAFYYTWWEMFPSNDIQVVGDTVNGGDKIVASVVKTGTSYALKVTDSTTSGNNVSTTQTCAAATCVDSSAEWIGEAPSGGRGEIPLPDFKSWKVTSASATSGSKTASITSWPVDEITMESDAGYALATPDNLNSTGTIFTDFWNNSY